MFKNNKEEYHLNYKCKYLLMCKREINSKHIHMRILHICCVNDGFNLIEYSVPV